MGILNWSSPKHFQIVIVFHLFLYLPGIWKGDAKTITEWKIQGQRRKKIQDLTPLLHLHPLFWAPRHLLPGSSILVASSLISLHLPLLFQPTWSSGYVIPLLEISWWVFVMGENPNPSSSLWVSACSVYTLPLPLWFHFIFFSPNSFYWPLCWS